MRLIDADALIRYIDANRYRSGNEKVFSELDVVEMINNQPTAYDVDKVERDCDIMQIKLAKQLLGSFRYAWCEKNKPAESEFNCEQCAFVAEDGRCLVKVFLKMGKVNGYF